jgi:predicted Fe-Mo cluster-binding NifX family protein
MKIAIPTANGLLCPHFGHCEEFTMVSVSPETREISGTERIPAPPHEPGMLPGWLRERGANVVIAGGMGNRARTLFEAQGVEVIVGAPVAAPTDIAAAYLQGALEPGENTCDH